MARHPLAFSCFLAAICLGLALGTVGAGSRVWAQTDQQPPSLGQLRAKVRQAGELFRQKKYNESGALVREVQDEMDLMVSAGDAAVIQSLGPVYESLKRAHALLELEGVTLPALRDPAASKSPLRNAPSPDAVSFASEIAPLLRSKCGRCHVDRAQGMFSMSSYAALMRGNNDGLVVIPRDSTGSRLVEVIESGDMPRGGQRLAAEELQKLKKWIDQGAMFDGDDPTLPLGDGGEPPTAAATQPKMATGAETVSFSRDVAVILAEQCGGCHGNGRRTEANLNLATYERLLQGGDGGAPILPGDSAASLLVQKLNGTADGQRMPRGRPPLSDETISRIATWINEGAAFDGPDIRQNIETIAAVATAQASSHEDLAERRRQRALEQWALTVTGVAPEIVQTQNFLLLGDATRRRMELLGERAESLAPRIAKALAASHDGQPLVKGKVTIFVFQRRYDYGEFGKMVEKRDLPLDQRFHWKFDVVEAYVAITAPEDDRADVSLTEPLGAVLLASRGAPQWFADAAGRLAITRIAANDPLVKQWKNQLPAVLSQMTKPDDAIEGRLPREAAVAANLSLVQFLYKDAQRLQRVLQASAQGEDFNQAFSNEFKAGPAQAAAAWARSLGRR